MFNVCNNLTDYGVLRNNFQPFVYLKTLYGLAPTHVSLIVPNFLSDTFCPNFMLTSPYIFTLLVLLQSIECTLWKFSNYSSWRKLFKIRNKSKIKVFFYQCHHIKPSFNTTELNKLNIWARNTEIHWSKECSGPF